DFHVTGVQTCALPISAGAPRARPGSRARPRPRPRALRRVAVSVVLVLVLIVARAEQRLLGALEDPLGLARGTVLGHVLDHLRKRSEERRVGKADSGQR